MINTTPAVPTVPAPTAPAPPPAPIPTSPASIVSGLQAELTGAEAAKMAQWAREDLIAEKISQGQAEKIFDDLGVPLEQRGTEEDTRSDEQRLLDKHFPAAAPTDYLIRWNRPGDTAPMTTELKQFDQSARTWLSGAEFPRELGNSLVSTIERVAQQTKHMNAAELENYGLVEYEKLQKVYGEALEDKLRAAGRMVEALETKTPGLKNILKRVGDNALVASMLIGQSERYWARRR